MCSRGAFETDRSSCWSQVPVVRNGAAQYVLGAGVDLAALTGILSQQHLPPDQVGTLLDRNKVIIGRTRAADRYVGQRPPPTRPRRWTRPRRACSRFTRRSGEAVYGAISRSPRTGWTIFLGVPQRTADAPLRDSLWLLLLVGGGSTLLGVVLAAFGARRIAQPIASLSSAAAILLRGDRIPPGQSAIAEVNAVTRPWRKRATSSGATRRPPRPWRRWDGTFRERSIWPR
jgi:hypothetical protein